MKISNSKKQLAQIIHENEGWVDGAEFSAQDKDGEVFHYATKPSIDKGSEVWGHKGCIGHGDFPAKTLPNWHQTILSRDEYFHLYPAPDADGWIEWGGGECPVGEDDRIDVKFSDGDTLFDVDSNWGWGGNVDMCDIIAYRLHKPEQAKPDYCESVTRSIPEPSDKPTIEQLAADYRNRKDYADRKQEEADAAKADAEAKLAELVAAGKALGLVLSVASPEPELVITDWRDLQVGDIIEYVDGAMKDKIGMSGPVVEFARYAADGLYVRLKCDNGPNKGRLGWPRQWRFIRRPAKGDANA